MALPTCECVRGLPPYDRLTAIYQAAVELSGDGSLPSELCVAAVPPFQRFGYIYAAFRPLAGDEALPSQECVEGYTPQDQVTEIYRAVLGYTGSTEDYLCARGLPIWQQWKLIYVALYENTSDPDSLVSPICANTTFNILSDVYCALLDQGCVTPVLESASMAANGQTLTLNFSEEVTSAAEFFDGLGFDFTINGVGFLITYISGDGTSTITFNSGTEVVEGDALLLSYSTPPGDVTNGDCPLLPFTDFPVVNNVGNQFTYVQPDGLAYFQPDGVSLYLQP